MQAHNFYRAGYVGATLITDRKLVEMYQDVINLVNTAMQTPGGNHGPQLVKAIDRLKVGINSDVPAFSPLEQEAWELMGLDQVLGPGGIEALEAAFRVHLGNMPAILTAVQKLQTKTLRAGEYSAAVASNALELMPKGASASEPPTIHIRCAGKANVETLRELADRADDWDVVLSTFAQLAGDPAESSKLTDVYRGSANFLVDLPPETWTLLGQVLDVLVKGLGAASAYYTLKKALGQSGVSAPAVDAKLEAATDKAKEEAKQKLLSLRPDTGHEGQARADLAIAKVAVLLNDGCEIHVLPGQTTTSAEFTARLSTTLSAFYVLRDGDNPDALRLSSGDRKPEPPAT